ncbi:hypothetical protein Q4511_09915 [Paracoccus sp. 1_MG-2023]|uniref:hypothetical protein n=1 Tax=unclassified Paracoccus (in: a-proteobacteria) TaxID=2688777 RepID=UPI001C082C95|nr:MULTISPECIES: hypothetical protein [unclassified Paracoccus (in: a-proteobacteria)]MBU2956721.1 hypothetical protein [Paracoccus sp. C2R09]MDO6669239.1 hypothetical protein [Paracoccus sp. 1_MG-2023]
MSFCLPLPGSVQACFGTAGTADAGVPPLDLWLSPQLQQALVAGVFLAIGWQVGAWQNRRRDDRLRAKREEDLQRALLAEIRAHVVGLEQQMPTPDDAAILIERVATGDLLPTLPQHSNDRIYAAVIAEIHILPGAVIDPIVIYYRLLSIMEALAADLRRIARRDTERAAQMMADYLSLMEETRDTGLHVMRVLTASLGGGGAAVERMYNEDAKAYGDELSRQLPSELAELRAGLDRRGVSNRSSDPRGR